MMSTRTNFENLPDWLSPAEVCSYLNLGRSSVYELIRSGEIASRKFGRLVRVPKTALSPVPNGEPLRGSSHA